MADAVVLDGTSPNTLPPVANGPQSANAASPPVTTSQSEVYRHKLCEISARATLHDPLNILFQIEKTGRATPVTTDMLYAACRARIDTKVAAGSTIVEAANFAAVACWDVPDSSPHVYTEAMIADIARSRPMFAKFIRSYQAARVQCLGPEQKYWQLSLMARDPTRSDKGAVRAVIEPYIALAKQQKLPLWLVAGNTRARDVYGYFGFRVIGTNESVLDGESATTYNMVCNWPPQ